MGKTLKTEEKGWHFLGLVYSGVKEVKYRVIMGNVIFWEQWHLQKIHKAFCKKNEMRQI